MLRWKQTFGPVAAILTLLLGVVAAVPVSAATACTGSVSVHTVPPVWSDQYIISVTNSGTTDISWVDITVPSSNFTYAGNSIGGGWQTADHGDGTTVTGNSLSPGQTANFPISAVTDVATAPAASWQVKVTSAASLGVNPASCSGDYSTAISGHPPNDSMNAVSNIDATGITTSGATITWDSDFPVGSIVYYGKTSDYGNSTPYDTAAVSNHTVTLSGLSAATGYHFQVAGSDGQGGYTYSSDNTFLTKSVPVKTPASTPPGQSVIVNKGVADDKVPPQISMTTNLTGTYKIVPTIVGTASDDKAVIKVEYSTDGGRNWSPVDSLQSSGQKKATFSFKPLLTQDGNYSVLARATDAGGNTTSTSAQTLIFDRLPPLVGGNIISVGPQIVQPTADGTVKVLQGIDQKLTLSAIGGPTSVTIEASTTVKTKKGPKVYSQSFSLTISEDSGLWSGVASFARAGTYTLMAHAVDGAGNKTDRALNSVSVASPGLTTDAKTGKPISATVTTYYLESESNSWVVWSADAFGQQNSQKTKADGEFRMFLPTGKYYVEARAPGYHTLVSNIVSANQPTPLTATLALHKLHGLHIGSHYLWLPSFGTQPIRLAASSTAGTSHNSLVGKPAPDFTLTDTTGVIVHTADLLGRPTVLSIESTWSPTTAEQLDSLSKLQANPDLNVLPVALQENAARVQAYTTIANVKLRWLVDPDSTLGSAYNVQSLPMHYFIDRKGIIRQVVVGVMTEKQLVAAVSEL